MKHKNIHSHEHSEFETFVKKRMDMSEEEQTFEAGLLIERLTEINTDRAYNNINQNIGPRKVFYGWFQQISKYAAILAVPLVLALSYSLYLNLKPEKTETVTYELICPVGIRSQAILPDGTKVWLNAQSSIKYKLPFTQNERNIELSGEAFFEVTKNTESPFIIHSQNTFVKVLGTKFDVRSYPGDEEIAVALEEGSVHFSTTDAEEKELQAILKPNDYLVFTKTDKKMSVMSGESMEKFTSWRYNRLILDETPIQQVAVLLERWYGIKVEIVDKELLNYKFSTTFENVSISQVLELIEISSPIRVKYVPNNGISLPDGSLNAKVFLYKK